MRPWRTGWLLLLPACTSHPVFQGPLPARNQHPAQLTVMQLPAAGSSTLPAGGAAGRLSTSYTSLFLQGGGGGNTFTMDGELLEVRPQLRLGLLDQLEFGLEVPFAHSTGGFLDDFVSGWHDFWGLPDQDRDLVEDDQWQVLATRQGRVAYEMREETARLLDLPLYLTWNLLPPAEHRLGLSLRGGVELPVGDDERGFGNGELDLALGALLEYRLAGCALLGTVQHTFAGTPDMARSAGLDFADVSMLGLGLELPLTGSLSALVQGTFETSTLRELHFDRVSREQVLLWLGGRWQLGGRWHLEFALGEDLQGHVSPDFSAYLALAWLPVGP